MELLLRFSNYVWQFVLLLFPAVMLLAAFKLFLSRRKNPILTGILALSALILLATVIDGLYIEPNRLELRRVRIYSSKVKKPVRILHVSDIQPRSINKRERRLFARINKINPDILIYTGDLMHPGPLNSFNSEIKKMSSLIDGVAAPYGIYSVKGNMDGLIARRNKIGKMIFLDNKEKTINANGTAIKLLGLTPELSGSPFDEISLRQLHSSIIRLLGLTPRSLATRRRVLSWHKSAAPDDFTILLGHSPDYILDMSDIPVDLCLAGHIHGGQVRVPFIGPLATGCAIPRSWVRGFRKVGRTRLNVSAGVGSEHFFLLPAIRLNCPPEITLIELLPWREKRNTGA